MEDKNQKKESEIETIDDVLEVAFTKFLNNLDKRCSWNIQGQQNMLLVQNNV